MKIPLYLLLWDNYQALTNSTCCPPFLISTAWKPILRDFVVSKRVEPQTLFGQQTGNDACPLPAVFDLSVVRSDPAAHLFRGVPGSVIPDHKQSLLVLRNELLAAVLKKLSGDDAHRRPGPTAAWPARCSRC